MNAFYKRIILFIALVAVQNLALAATLETLFEFNSTDGAYPYGGLLRDAKGNLYGTTGNGGANNQGTVFRMNPSGKGQPTWSLTTLHEFNGTDGSSPVYIELIRDAKGALYGTTWGGGAHGAGTVFKLTPPAKGQTAWTQSLLYEFNTTDGANPLAGLLRDAQGALYGTTQLGGVNNKGTVFKLTPPAKGQTVWTQTLLHEFNTTDGANPYAALLRDPKGALYGTTQLGGVNNKGTVFKLTPPAKGQTVWTQSLLHEFNGTDGGSPWAGLIRDAKGNLYGVTIGGGANDKGTVYKLTPPAKGQTVWTQTLLHEFNGTDGVGPLAGGLARDAKGTLYGTTWSGGANSLGTVYKLTPPAKGQTAWTQTLLHEFNTTDGAYPYAGLIRDAKGALYGTTFQGGANNVGTVFKLTP